MPEPVFAQQGALWIVAAGALAVFGYAIASRILSQARDSEGATRLAWVLLTGLVAGGSAWAAYFTCLAGLSFGTVAVYDAVAILMMLGVLVVAATLGAYLMVTPLPLVPVFAGVLVCFAAAIAMLFWYGPTVVTIAGNLARPPVATAVVATVATALCCGSVAVVMWRQARPGIGGHIGLGLAVALATLFAYAASVHGLEVRSGPGAYLAATQSDVTRTVFVIGLTAFILVFDLAALGAVLINTRDRADQLLRTRELVDAAVEGIVIVRDGKISSVNRPMLELTGRSETEIIGSRLEAHLSPDDDQADFAALAPGESAQVRLSQCNGPPRPVEVIVNSLGRKDGMERVLAVRDISERLAAEKTIRHLANHDGLTGLPNRDAARAHLDDCARRHGQSGEPFALLLYDLDFFKNINDLYGHAAGDEVLCAVSSRVAACLGSGDYLSRLGGDEFAIVLSGGGVIERANLLAEALRRSFPAEVPLARVGGVHAAVGLSAGGAFFPGDADSVKELLSNADLALYHVKREGRGGVYFFQRGMESAIREDRQLASDLRMALERSELVLHYQPQISLSGEEIVGFEALARWTHPGRGPIRPDVFIPVAEKTGLIFALGEWAIETACREAAAWPRPYRVAVNVSPWQLKHAGLVELVRETLMRTGLSPRRLEVEITETALVDDPQAALDTLRGLKALGVGIALDDFGAGYSSLVMLRLFPFDKIKIDRRFLEKFSQDYKDRAIIEAIVGLGQTLGVAVLAEGVETAEQKEYLTGLGCPEAQGIYYSPPLPVKGLRDLLERRRADDASVAPATASLVTPSAA